MTNKRTEQGQEKTNPKLESREVVYLVGMISGNGDTETYRELFYQGKPEIVSAFLDNYKFASGYQYKNWTMTTGHPLGDAPLDLTKVLPAVEGRQFGPIIKLDLEDIERIDLRAMAEEEGKLACKLRRLRGGRGACERLLGKNTSGVRAED